MPRQRTQHIDEQVQQAKQKLEQEGYRVVQTSPYQLKVGHINYWPSTGTIREDGYQTSEPGHGFDALLKRLAKTRDLRNFMRDNP